MKKREIFIIIVLIAFGVIYNAYKSGKIEISLYEGCSIDPRSLLDRRHANDFQRDAVHYTFEEIKAIEIDNPAGGIVVEKGEENSSAIKVETTVRVYHRDSDEAAKIDRRIEIAPTTGAGTGKLKIAVTPGEDFPYRRVRVYFKLIVPAAASFDFRSRYGNIKITGCGQDVSLDAAYGDIAVRGGAPGSTLKIRHRYGDVIISDRKDNVELSSRYSKIKIKNIAALSLDCAHSRAYLEAIQAKTDITRASYSTIKMEDARDVKVHARHTGITLEKINGGLDIENSYQTIYIKDIKGNIDVNARDCKTTIKNAVSDSISVENSYDTVRLQGVSAKNMDFKVKHGKLDIAFEQAAERINIKNRYCRIRMKYPAAIQPLFNIDIKQGRLINRTPLVMTILKDEDRNRLSANSNDTGTKPHITIDNAYGDVYLDNSSPAR
jgi:hypothetical protein